MSQEIHGNGLAPPVDLFTQEEHRVLSYWFGVEAPASAAGLGLADALECIGIGSEDLELYEPAQAAVALILLERVSERLPNFGPLEEEEEAALIRGERSRETIPSRKVAMVPQHLFTVNWADSGPGFSWPGAYYAIWVPVYDRYVITYSADTAELWGYRDFALGHFRLNQGLKSGSRRVITQDWNVQSGRFQQGRWVYLFSEGLVHRKETESWADAVWPEGDEW